MSELATALTLRGGIVAAIGAGGKKSVLNELAAGATEGLAWTGTVFTARPPRWTGVEVHIGQQDDLLALARKLRGTGRHAFLLPSEKSGRYGGLSTDAVDRLHTECGFEMTLVKADGARMRGLKCPKPGEPVLPARTRTVLMVLSAQVLGQPLDETWVHRPERVASVLDLEPGDTLEPAHLAAVFTRPGGISEGTEGLDILPIINQVDDERSRELATEAAKLALTESKRFDRVVLTCLKRSNTSRNPVVDVIERDTAS